jgi:hypothetical protein
MCGLPLLAYAQELNNSAGQMFRPVATTLDAADQHASPRLPVARIRGFSSLKSLGFIDWIGFIDWSGLPVAAHSPLSLRPKAQFM